MPTDTSIAKGGDAKLNCTVINKPTETFVTWIKGETVIFINTIAMNPTGFPRYSIEGEYNLQIVNAQESDDAIFSCTVQNLGVQTAKLTVLGKVKG